MILFSTSLLMAKYDQRIMPNYKNRTRLEYDDTNDVYRLPEL